MLVRIFLHSPSTHKTLFLLPGAFHFGICSLQSVSRDHGHGALGHNVQDYSRHVFAILLFAATTVESGTWLLQLRLGCRRKGWRRWARWPLIGPGKVMWRVWNGIVWYGMVWSGQVMWQPECYALQAPSLFPDCHSNSIPLFFTDLLEKNLFSVSV